MKVVFECIKGEFDQQYRVVRSSEGVFVEWYIYYSRQKPGVWEAVPDSNIALDILYDYINTLPL